MTTEPKDRIKHETKPVVCCGKSGEGKTIAGIQAEQQSLMTKKKTGVLADTKLSTKDLMIKVCDKANLNQAYKRVKANKGAAGVDGMTIDKTLLYIRLNREQIISSLLDGSYKPKPVRKVTIPKPGGGERQLGIPTVLDRVVQQAIHQILEPIFDPKFSDSSYGFRPKRSAHQAVKRAKQFVADGCDWVVDIDLEKFFDRVNHDLLMSKLAKQIEDKMILKIIRAFLSSGCMDGGLVAATVEGTPQGGNLSPLLSNIMLDTLDKELEKRGHKFCRYADDQNIYVRSKLAGERVYASIESFLEKKLKLKVNKEKSAVAKVSTRKFLGYQIASNGRIKVSKTAIARMKDKIRILTKRSQGKSFKSVIGKLNLLLRGWLNYYKLAESKSLWSNLDSWIKRRLRAFRLRQRKKGSSISKMLRNLGVARRLSSHIASSGKGEWRLSKTHALHQALNNSWFKAQGLLNLQSEWSAKYSTKTAVCETARTVV